MRLYFRAEHCRAEHCRVDGKEAGAQSAPGPVRQADQEYQNTTGPRRP